MTTEEAFAHLGIVSHDEAEDAFETALFETKQFLLSKPVFLKTFESRLAKLRKQQQAFLALDGEEEQQAFEVKAEFHPSENVVEHFLSYHAAKNAIRQAISATVSFSALEAGTQRLIALEQQFAEPFAAFTNWTENDVTIGKEPDSMEVLSLLREQALKERITLAEIQQTINDVPEELRLVLKRLSLLKNYLHS